MRRYRIIEEEGIFYIQQKGLFGWRDIGYHTEWTWELEKFKTDEDAEQFIRKLGVKKPKAVSRVVKEIWV